MLNRPGRTSIVLVTAAFATLFGSAAAFGDEPGEWSKVVGLLFFVLWWAAIAVHVPTAPARLRPVLAAGFVVYVVAFLLPSATQGRTEYLGWECFLQALAWVPEAWIANPIFLIAVALVRRDNAAAGAVVGLLALGAGALAPAHHGITVHIGFFVWMAGIAIASVGPAFASIAIRRPVSALPTSVDAPPPS